MKPSEKAEVLIQQARDKAQADFQQWKEGELAPNLKHKSAQEAREFLRQKYLALQNWYSKNSSPKHLFDVVGTSPEKLAIGWAACFIDWKDGLIPLPGRTPEYSAEAWDMEGNYLGPFIPASWMWPLSERFMVALCLEYLDSQLEAKPAIQQKPETMIQALYYYYLMKAGEMPDLQGQRKELEELGKKLGLGPVSFYQTFSAVKKKGRDKNPLKPNILEVVIPMLADYPEAQAMAKKDLAALQKHTKE